MRRLRRPRLSRRLLRALAVARPQATALLLATAAGCGDDQPTPPEPPRIEDLAFAPELGIDLAAMTLHPLGLYVQDLVEGDGPATAAQAGARFEYRGWLHDGTPVDQGTYPESVFRSPGAFVSAVDGQLYYLVGSGQTIAAWDIGLVGIRVGGTRRVVAPPNLAYGARGSPDGRVPPNAVLVYEFRVLAVEP